ncbi:MAG: pitrilysin family protein [Bacteroidota bacterium]
MIDRTTAPKLNVIDQLEISSPEHATLDNGIPVFLFDAGAQEIVRIDFLFEAGSRYQQHPLVARFTNKMLSEGTKSYTAFEIAEKLDYYGAYLGKMAFKDTGIVCISMLNKHIENILPIIAEIITEPVFPEKELQTISKRAKQAYIDDRLKVSEMAAMHFNQQLFGKKHPYGKIVEVSDFDQVKPEYLKDFHKTYYIPDSCKIVVSGKAPADIMALLNRYFGHFKTTEVARAKEAAFTLSSGNKHEFIAMSKSVQSAIRIGNIGISKRHEDYPAFFVLNTILGGYFGSRLMKNIREDKGYTYGIYSTTVQLQESALFFISTEVGSDVCHNAITEIHHEFDHLRSELVTETELDLVKKYLSGSILRSFDGPFQTAERFKNLLELNIDFKNYYSNLIHVINTITAKDLMITAQKYFVEEGMFEMVVGKKTV